MVPAAVLACALKILGPSAQSLPAIELIPRPPDVAADVEAFVRAGEPVIWLITDSDAFEAARASDCRDAAAVAKLASILVHEQWHVSHGASEADAYQAQLEALARWGVSSDSRVYQGIQRSRQAVVNGTRRRVPNYRLERNGCTNCVIQRNGTARPPDRP